MMSQARLFLKFIVFNAYRILSKFIKVKYNHIYFIPHINCNTDRYNIINYQSDNVLSLLNYILRQKSFKSYTIYVEVYDYSEKNEYIKYCEEINKEIQVVFVKNGLGINHLKIKNIFLFFKCYYCFTADHHYDLRYKKKIQNIICLGYFTPFKNDFRLMPNKYELEKKRNNKCFNYYITTSQLSSRIISVDTGISYYKFKPLGFSRNDLFYNKPDLNLKNDRFPGIKKLILYTPTFRNYEYKKTLSPRNIFGYSNADMNKLNSLLLENDAILIAKLHPFQNKTLFKEALPDRIIIESNPMLMNLYQYLSITDVLITDYTSTYFDFLLNNKPVIFNFYDKERFEKDRGFSFHPIEQFCAGQIVSRFDELIEALNKLFIDPNDNFNNKRMFINNIFNLNQDGQSSKRICDYFFNH